MLAPMDPLMHQEYTARRVVLYKRRIDAAMLPIFGTNPGTHFIKGPLVQLSKPGDRR